MITEVLLDDAAALLDECRAKRVKLATAESCTGGLIAAVLTAVAGSSNVVERGSVVYSNDAKTELLGVPAELIGSFGAISDPVAQRMAEGALLRSHADLAVSVTGVAGPGGGSVEKPVGVVYFGLAQRGHATTVDRRLFSGDRTAVRLTAIERAFTLIRAGLRRQTISSTHGSATPRPRTSIPLGSFAS
jgi:nicotinamide-nucleotide amidase